MADVTMPQLGETVTEGTITRWFKQVGDRVEEDENLYEVSTDKVDSEVPSPVSGFLAEIVVQEGETVEVGAKLAVISDSEPAGGGGGADDGAATAADSGAQAEAPAEAEAEAPAAPAAPEQAPKEAAEAAPEPAPAPEAAPAAQGAAPSAAGPSGGESPNGGGKLLSPVVRRLISENNLDPDQINGTGAGGRITRADVLAVIDQHKGSGAAPAKAAAQAGRASAPASAATAAPAAGQSVQRAEPMAPATAGERDERVPFSNIRRRTAEHMVRSQATSAHTLVVIEVDYDNVDKVRNRAKEQFKAEEGTSLTYLPFISRAVIDAIREFPHVNASVGDNELIVHRYVNLGIAVDLNFEGLIVPVVQDADGKRLRVLAREFSDLANRARSKKLGADDISGGTFTITNAGPFGTLLTAPVINQPQVAILATDGVKMKPVAIPLSDGGYGIAVHPVGNLALSFDHRAYDGAYASAFVAKIKEILETRDWAAELA